MFLHKNVGFFSQLPILYFRQVTVIPTISYQNDPYLNYVVLNINGDTALSGNNNTFLDSGFRGLSSTGNVTQGTFSPFSPAGWSGYFDGSSYLNLTASGITDFGANPYTFECYFWMGSIGFQTIYDGRAVGGDGFTFNINANDLSKVYIVVNTGTIVTSTAALVSGSWNHIAVCRTSTGASGATIYINGVGQNFTDSNTYVNPRSTIGASANTLGSNKITNGYISNLRIVKGTALYTTNFTPNSAEQLKLLPNTSLLTLQDNRFVDNSRNNFTLSATGTPQIQSFSPIAPAVDYTPSLHGGSAYFDGSSRISTINNLNLSNTSDLTIEFWVYQPNLPTSVQGYIELWGTGPMRIIIGRSSTGIRWYLSNAGPERGFTYTKGIGEWMHLAITYTGGRFRVYVDGVLSANDQVATWSTSEIYIGRYRDVGEPFTGYISNIRVVKGQAVYTSNFTPPSRPVTATSNGGASVGTTAVPNLSVTPSLLLDFDNGGIIDRSYKNDALVFGDAKTQTLSSKFGTGSLYFDGTGDYLSILNNNNLSFQSNPFTIEFWWNPAGNTNYDLLGKWGTEWILQYRTGDISGGPNGFRFAINTSTLIDLPYNSLVTNVWSHIAITKDSNNIYRLFVNGTQSGSNITQSATIGKTSNNLNIGGTTSYFNGYLEDIRITNGVARYTANFTPPSKLQANNSDPYYSNVVLFLDGNNIGSNVNNEFRATAGDAARLAITRTGATQGSFSPFNPNGWSGFFNGSSYLTVPDNAAFKFGSNNFTVEAWINFENVTGEKVIASKWNAGGSASSNQWVMWLNGNIPSFTFSTDGNAAILVTGTTILTNQWYHIAAVRNGSSFNVYVNGVAGTTVTNSGTLFATETEVLGISYRRDNGLASGKVTGYISNLRIVKGQALYTSTFTPPTGPLPALSGSGFSTSLLTLQDNRFKDNSPNNFALSVGAGTPSVQAFNPYKQSTAYSPTLHGGSGYFDGSSYLTVPANQAFNLDGDFTIECWVNTSVFNVESIYTRHLITMGTGADAANLLKVALLTTAGAASNVISLYTTSAILVGNIVVADGRWHHIAVTRSGTNLRLYVDGVQSGSTTTTSPSFNAGATTNIQIGRYNNAEAGRWNGYISNLRVVKGRALYTSTFTPPTSPVTAVNGTSLLLNFDNGYAIDSTGNNVITTVGDSRTDVLNTAPLSSSTGSLYFDGTGDYLHTVSSPTFDLSSSGDFTIEFWMYATNINTNPHIFEFNKDNGNRWALYRNTTLQIFTSIASSNNFYNTTITDSEYINKWVHIAIVKISSSTYVYLNGVLKSTSSITYPTAGNFTCALGISFTNISTANSFSGYIDDFRITKGVARYTSNFTPQTYENPTSNILTYPTDPYRNLVVLDLNADTVNNEQNNTFLDRSGNNLTITRTGSTTQGSFSPFSPAGWSGYFNGQNGNLSILNPNKTIGSISGDFTIECWVNWIETPPGDAGGTERQIIGQHDWPGGPGSLENWWTIMGIRSGVIIYLNNIDGSSNIINSTSFAWNANVWYHLAVSRLNGVLRIYVNGINVTSGTGATTRTIFADNTTLAIGGDIPGDQIKCNAYISNLRIVKGQALYTSNFTPPTAALTTTSTVGGVTLSAENVVLLTLQDNRFKDNSNSNFTITPIGTPSVKPFSPFQPTATYSPTVHGGSGYFNGSYLEAGISSSLNVNSDYTIETWFYKTGTSINGSSLFLFSNSTTNGTHIYFNTSNQLLINNGVAAFTTFTTPIISNNVWYHLAAVRSGTVTTVYLNGVSIGTSTYTPNTTDRVSIGGYATDTSYRFVGYLSNLRVVRGVAITPPVGGPTAPVQAVSGTSLLLNFDNAGVVDSTGKNNVTTFDNAKVDYANLKYGTGALKFDGTNDYMQVGTASDWTFLHSPSAKWTIEFWVYNNSTGLATIFDTANTVSTQAGITINKDTNDKIAVFVLNGAGGSSGGIGFTIESNPISNSALPLSTWTHVAITYDHSLASNNVACYLNGVFSGSASKTVNNPSSVTPANPLSIGCAGNGRVQFFNGSIDELRITNAVRYTGNFSVSSYTLPLSS